MGMATGVPKRRRQTAKHDGNGRKTARSCPQITLSYDGKRSEQEILLAPRKEANLIWQGRRSKPLSRLYAGDNLGILRVLLDDRDVAGKVRLVYIDPPFATQTVFHSRDLSHAFDDQLNGTEFIEFLRARLVLIRELLSDDGSIYLHLDSKMVFHMKVVMDEIFGPTQFRNCITRKKCNPKNYTRKQYGNVADYILFYTKTDSYIWNRPVEKWTDERAKEYQYVDPKTGRRFMKVPVHAPGVRNGETGQPWRGVLPPPGKHWQFPPSVLDEMDARGEIYWSPNGNPRRKVYLDESPGIGVQDVWMDFRDAHNQNIKITGYPTEKNAELLRRIINASSLAGDLVLDCFSGSGTTLTVAADTERHWIGVDNSAQAIGTTLRRFVKGVDRMGDFVSQRSTQQMLLDIPRPPRQLELELQESEATASAADSGSRTLGAILDFQLLADDSMRESICKLVKKWSGREHGQTMCRH